MNELDLALGAFFDALDGLGVDYEVVLTADHGAHDMTERQQQRAMPMEQRVSPALSAKEVAQQVAAKLGLTGAVLIAPEGDVFVAPDVPAAKRQAVIDEAVRLYRAQPQVAAVLTAKEIAATPMPSGSPETWTLAERARASHDDERSAISW